MGRGKKKFGHFCVKVSVDGLTSPCVCLLSYRARMASGLAMFVCGILAVGILTSGVSAQLDSARSGKRFYEHPQHNVTSRVSLTVLSLLSLSAVHCVTL